MPVDVFQLLRPIGGWLVIPIHISIIGFIFPYQICPSSVLKFFTPHKLFSVAATDVLETDLHLGKILQSPRDSMIIHPQIHSETKD